MNSTHIRSFLAAVKYQSFTKAAEHTFITPSVLSKHIAALEKELDVPLFYRYRKTVKLTEAGRIFADAMEEIDVIYRRTLTSMKANLEQYRGQLFIGMLEGQLLDSAFHRVLAEVRNNNKQINIQIAYYSIKQLLDSLIDGSIDIALTAERLLAPVSANLDSRLIREGNTCLYMSANHPHANRKDVTLNDFQDDNFIILNQNVFSTLSKLQSDVSELRGSPNKTVTAPNFETMELWVESGIGIAIASPWGPMNQNPAITSIALTEVHPIREVIAWQTNNSNPYIPLFLNALTPICDAYSNVL